MAHEDRLLQKGDEGARGFGKPAVGGLVPVDDEVIGGVALGAGDGVLEGAGEGVDAELAEGVGAGADGGDSEVHWWVKGSILTSAGSRRVGGIIFLGCDGTLWGGQGEEVTAVVQMTAKQQTTGARKLRQKVRQLQLKK